MKLVVLFQCCNISYKNSNTFHLISQIENVVIHLFSLALACFISYNGQQQFFSLFKTDAINTQENVVTLFIKHRTSYCSPTRKIIPILRLQTTQLPTFHIQDVTE
jgi:hypothetical protein